jgi:hypothetical protein
MPKRDSASGLTSTRTDGSAAPPSSTLPTPCTWSSFCCTTVETAS